MNVMIPLPSSIRASAWDAGNAHMHKAGRTKWAWDDFTAASAEHERLVAVSYARPNDQRHHRYVRFQIAEQMERAGLFTSTSSMADIHRQIDLAMEGLKEGAASTSSAEGKRSATAGEVKTQPAASPPQ
jgi:hypothetical protein